MYHFTKGKDCRQGQGPSDYLNFCRIILESFFGQADKEKNHAKTIYKAGNDLHQCGPNTAGKFSAPDGKANGNNTHEDDRPLILGRKFLLVFLLLNLLCFRVIIVHNFNRHDIASFQSEYSKKVNHFPPAGRENHVTYFPEQSVILYFRRLPAAIFYPFPFAS
jgi:hypothetical protein